MISGLNWTRPLEQCDRCVVDWMERAVKGWERAGIQWQGADDAVLNPQNTPITVQSIVRQYSNCGHFVG